MKILVLIGFASMIFSFTKDDPFKQLQRLQGTWKNVENEKHIEIWNLESNNVLQKKSYYITVDTFGLDEPDLKTGLKYGLKPDTSLLSSEQIKSKDSIVYIEGRKIDAWEFSDLLLVESSNKIFVFESKRYVLNYPYRIIYSFISKDSLMIRHESEVYENGFKQFLYVKRG